MENTSTAAPVSPEAPVANQDAANEQLLGRPKESVATVPVLDDKDVPIVPVAKKKIKWGDTEKEVSFDEAVQMAQKAWGIEEKAKTHAQKVQQAESILQMLQTDYKGFVKQCKVAGVDPQKLATDILYEQIRLNSLSPEQRKLEEYEAQEAERLAEAKAKEEESKKAEIDTKTREWQQKFEGDLQKALAEKKLPMSRLTLALTAQYIDGGLAQKKEYTVEQVLPFVMRDLQNIHRSTMGSLEGDALLEYLGEDISNKVAAARVAHYKKGQPPVSSAPAKKETSQGSLPKAITQLKGKAYWAALRRQKSAQDIGAFPGQD